MADVLVLFDEYAAAFARGEDPDLRAYLVRAGDAVEEFARLVDAYMTRTVPPAPSPERVTATQAWLDGRSSLRELRGLRKQSLQEVASGLVRLLGLDPAKQKKVARYYAELEAGALEPRGVSVRVWDALAEVLRMPANLLSSWRPLPPPPAAPAPAVFRSASAEYVAAPAGMAKAAADMRERDEVDALFGK